MASEDSSSATFHVAASTRIAGPLFSIILTDPASTGAVRLRHHCHFPAIPTVTAKTNVERLVRQSRQSAMSDAAMFQPKKTIGSSWVFWCCVTTLIVDHKGNPPTNFGTTSQVHTSGLTPCTCPHLAVPGGRRIDLFIGLARCAAVGQPQRVDFQERDDWPDSAVINYDLPLARRFQGHLS
ncbi:hypothetical protein OPT61_g5547 [Boeremia exigua]|uniref:Uncharacterized protein n=1 Tax=Boeremia exigua TaxID=749465 RepID=A0ACC2I9V9_9PLEO|nr:hypothetical protein OPT61_g5547 [Boeremia exigua]